MTDKTVADNRLLHGGDYNPDQWLDYPEILKDDLRLMKLAKANTFTLGVFAWSALEPTEGEFQFDWLDERIEAIYQMGGRVILATPSGARPAWMSKKYPEVLRTTENRMKMLHGGRHNHCFSSPIYREKVAIINRKLAERYGNHPALLMWHISNEYSGDCHCGLCQDNFRNWLKKKYGTLDKLNHAWWGPFWSHTITDWSEVESPSSIGESMVHGLNLDWKRFVTDQTIDFYKHEIVPLREISPSIPITTNFMADTHDLIPFQSLNYSEFAKHVDIVSWDCYPAWHNDWEETKDLAAKVGFINDLYRSLKQQPFLIMESTPSGVNWHDVNKTKRPGMHLLSSMQFIAHGSDSVLYFQWRKSRGSSEKFHGAVVDHDNSETNRVFQEVSAVGGALEKIAEVKGTHKQARVAIVYDWENNWALNDAQGFSDSTKQYPQTLQKHYQSFWKKDISVDIVTLNQELASYDLVIAPMLYMMSLDTISKLENYVANGGTLVSSYISGLVNETDLAHLSGWPATLKRIFGIDVKETDTLYPKDRNTLTYNGKQYEIKDYCTIFERKEANILATYMEDFYQGNPAVVENCYGKGKAYFIGARTEQAFLDDFYEELQKEGNLDSEREILHKEGVSVQRRDSAECYYLFVMNFTEQKQTVTLKESFFDLLTQEIKQEQIELLPYEVRVLKREK
ncbi:beta-galactosidase [Niallia circulans]|jgi:beta-galactosidase|uniref:beta-galactosidase n=1 Tax=Niallia circulans TaxID=1397 RepID=UPI00077C96AB|nr:beta-galactosidase [Niallia circulans]MDR4318127.1 beta-galactosidase [Niallia circulans]MED3838644.1 beta-galactosidase [Niallia circulans]MED4244468.1 beta-galactosidase [Niallia circulans]MED4249389.1 beta-galactosidase [Niallia circulans]PAD87380.1 beta-galactosidase [Niallia circulans]